MSLQSQSHRFKKVAPPASILKKWEKTYKSYKYDFSLWLISAGAHLLGTFYLLISGVLFSLIPALIHFLLSKASFIENYIILVNMFYVFLTFIVYYTFRKRCLDQYIYFKSFEHLYRHCTYVPDEQLANFRISQARVLHPSLFTYAFSGSTFIIMVGKKEPAPTQETELSTIIDSTVIPIADAVPTEQADKRSEEGSQKEQNELLPTLHTSVRLHIYLCPGPSIALSELIDDKVLDLGKNHVVVPLNNMDQRAIIAYLALQERGKPVPHYKLTSNIYGDDVSDRFHQHVNRIRKQITRTISQEFPQATQKFDPFENKHWRKDSTWRLTSGYVVEEVDLLSTWEQDIQAVRGRSRTLTSKRIDEVEKLIGHYSNGYRIGSQEDYQGGYLVDVLDEGPFERWAPKIFERYRKRYLFVLMNCAYYAYSAWEKTQKPEYMEKAGRWYKECMYAATCSRVDQSEGEKALRSAIKMYCDANDQESAQELCTIFRKRMSGFFTEWEPENKTKELLQKYDIDID